jgi:hypothetical protein
MQTLPLNEISSSKIQNNTKIIQNDKQAIKIKKKKKVGTSKELFL